MKKTGKTVCFACFLPKRLQNLEYAQNFAAAGEDLRLEGGKLVPGQRGRDHGRFPVRGRSPLRRDPGGPGDAGEGKIITVRKNRRREHLPFCRVGPGKAISFSRFRDIDDIARHRAGGGLRARAAPVEHHVADVVALDQHPVEHAGDGVKRMLARDEAGTDSGGELPLPRSAGGRDQFDRVPEALRESAVPLAQARDPLGGDGGDVRHPAESDSGEDGDLAAGVEPFDIGARIRFRVAVFLRLAEGFFKGNALFLHFRQDIVGRAVEDPVDPLDRVGTAEIFLQRADHGDPAADARFKAIIGAVLFRLREQLGAVRRHQLLVGGNHAFPRAQQRKGELQRGMDPADRLRRDRDRRILRDLRKIVRDQRSVRAIREIAEVKDLLDPDLLPAAAADGFGVIVEQFDRAGADDPEPENRDMNHKTSPSFCFFHFITGKKRKQLSFKDFLQKARFPIRTADEKR